LAVGAKHGRLPGPVAAEGGVEDELHVVEVFVDGAARAALESCSRGTPGRWVGVCTRDVRGGLALGPKPDVDVVGGPFGGVDASTGAVQAVAIGGGAAGGEAAALVGEAGFAGKGAALGGMHGHGVAGLEVDAFENVDFTVSGPACGLIYLIDWDCCLPTKWEGQASRTRARYRRRWRACERGPRRRARVDRFCSLRRGYCHGRGRKQHWSSQHAC